MNLSYFPTDILFNTGVVWLIHLETNESSSFAESRQLYFGISCHLSPNGYISVVPTFGSRLWGPKATEPNPNAWHDGGKAGVYLNPKTVPLLKKQIASWYSCWWFGPTCILHGCPETSACTWLRKGKWTLKQLFAIAFNLWCQPAFAVTNRGRKKRSLVSLSPDTWNYKSIWR